MTLLTIVQTVADGIGLPRPTAVATGTDQLARQMFALSNEVLEDLAGSDWPSLSTSYQFSTVAAQAAYTLPNDFARCEVDTVYLASQYYKMRGALTPADWQRESKGANPTLTRYSIRIFGDPMKVNIVPTPQTVESVVLEYISSNSAKDTNGTPIAKFLADSDNPRFPEEIVRKGLKWKIKHAKGLDYSEDFNDYQMSKARLLAQQLALGSIPVAYRSASETPELTEGYVRETGFGV